jgi:hypothetical protein
MENNSSLKMSAEERASLRAVLIAAEGAREGRPNVSIVRNGNSGLTVGEIQIDLSEQKDVADELFAVARAKGLDKAVRVNPHQTITADLLKAKHRLFRDDEGNYDRAAIAKVENFMREIVATPEGKEVLERAEARQLKLVADTTDRLCAKSVPNAKEVCGTAAGRRDIAVFVHQDQGNAGRLGHVLAGGKTTIGKLDKKDPGVEVQITGPLKADGLRKLSFANTVWGRKNAKALEGRYKRIDNIPVPTPPKTEEATPAQAAPEKRSDSGENTTEQQAAKIEDNSLEQVTAAEIDESDETAEEEAPIQLAELPPAPAQTAMQSLQQPLPEERRQPWEKYPQRPPFNFLDPTMKSPRYNLPSGLAALLGIPHAPGGSPDGAFVDLAKQVGGDGLPPHVSDLLGSGVSRTNPKSAVKLFQTTINALNKPEDFDWNWSTSGKIDVDGDLGPQTRAGFGRALEKVGADGFARKFALGQFRDYATRLDNGIERYENLAGSVDGSLGRVDRNAAATFQDYLNDARDTLPTDVRYEGLKRDGWIGPKTTDAFKTALYNLGPKTIADDLEGLFGV